MSEICIYVPLPQYVREWCRYHFGNPSVFPSGTNLNAVIRHFMRQRPDNCPPRTKQPGELAVVLTGSRSKRPEQYNYVSPSGIAAIAEAISDLFVMHMWEDLTSVGARNVQLSKLIMDWMDSNGISMEGNNYENLRQKFLRIKDKYRTSSKINISRGYKHERF